MLEKLCKLRNEWQQAYPQKATGGVYALAGFNYQFGVFLLNFLNKWAMSRKNHEPIPSPKNFAIEAISDITELTSDGIIFVTQVKLSSDPDYTEIFNEFWDIYDLAKRVIPNDESNVRFVLCKSDGASPDIQKKFRAWAKRQKKSELRTAELELLLDVRVLSQPEDQILGMLANDLHDDRPAEHLFQWLGRLLSASPKNQFESHIQEIYNDLVRITNAKDLVKSPIYVWQATDRPPSDVSQGDVLTGAQPRPWHLRRGFFAPRPKVYADLAETFTQWRQSQAEETDCSLRLPVFWVGGRSGSGKSVALLHLLAHIHSQGNIHIFWLRDNIGYLSDAIRWASILREQGHDAIIAADDPFAPATQQHAEIWQNAFASLEPLRCKGDIESMPILLCCGPTEHGSNLDKSYPDNVAVKIATLPLEEQSDYDALRAWYKQRTGNDAPEVGDDNVLLVQLFFEWRTKGTLREFATRFEDRIKKADPAGDLYKRFSRVLASNRLYVGYPKIAFESGLTSSQLESVDRLKRDNHLSDMDIGRKGVWLAHPHLSNAIYEVWHPVDTSARIREEHLTDIINNALQFGDTPSDKTAPLWAISRSLSIEEEEPSDFRVDEFKGVVTIAGLSNALFLDGYRANTQNQRNTIEWLNDMLKVPDLFGRFTRNNSSQPPSDYIDVLKNVYDKTHNEADLKKLNRSLIEEFYPLVTPRYQEEEPIVGRLDRQTVASLLPNIYRQRFIATPDRQMPVFELPVWIQLRANLPDITITPDPFDLAIGKLQPEKITVGFRLMCHKLLEHRVYMTEVQASQLTESLSKLLALTIHSWNGWPHIATDFYTRTGNTSTEILLSAWLNENSRTSIAQQTLTDLLQSERKSAAIDNAASANLIQVSDDSFFWADIAKQIYKRRSSDSALRNVAEWTATHCEEFRVGFLLAEMVRGGLPEAVNWALSWAQIWHKERSANWVLEALCEQSGCNSRIRDWCIAWLNLDYPQTNPGFLAEKLMRAFPEDPIVRENILQWLKRTPPYRPTWFFVWNVAYTNAPADSLLIKMGINGLIKAWPVHKLWLSSWQKLWQASGARGQLIDIGLNWLRRLPMTKMEWLEVWNVLWQASNQSKELFEIGLKWLSVCMRSKSWGACWRELWSLKYGDARLISLAHRWLNHHIRQWNVWFAIWQEIWKTNKENETTLDLAQRWLSIAPSSLPSWVNMWGIVWRYNGADDTLRSLGMKWLLSTDRVHNSWQQCWAFLWNDRKGDPELRSLGYEWLNSVPQTHGSWPKMWKDLWPIDKTDPALLEMGLDWVANENNFYHGDWQHNWKELVTVPSQKDNLLSLGEKWLRVIPVYNIYWVDVWLYLSKYMGMSPNLLDLAKRWLQQTSPERNKWSNLWLKIRTVRADTSSLRQKVSTFIEENPKAAEWFQLWVSLRERQGDNKGIDAVGLRWLDYMLVQRPETQNWHQVWTILWEAEISCEKLDELARQWLRRVPANNTTWHTIWRALRDAQPDSPDIMKLGREWLKKAKPHNQGWYEVWRSLFDQNKSDQAIIQQALEWLEKAVGNNLSWGDCWMTLYEFCEDKNVLESFALTWLARTSNLQHAHAWSKIWRILWDKDKARDRLFTCGMEWLKAAPRGVEGRAQVFDPLWQSGQNREVLQELEISLKK